VWNINGEEKNIRPRLPVRYRYRSPIFFEFHVGGKRHTDCFAAIWLNQLVDNEPTEFDIPVWRCNSATRLSQNYITEENFREIPDIKIEEVGRLRFSGRFKAGTDRDHLRFVSDNDSRETIETWEACFAEGVRQEVVNKEVPPTVQKLHDESLTQGRDVLALASEEEKKKWLAKDGTDWTGAFGKDPTALMSGQPGEDSEDEYEEIDEDESGESKPNSPLRLRHAGNTDLGVVDATQNGADETNGPRGSVESGNGAMAGEVSCSITTDSGATTSGSSSVGSPVTRRDSKNPIKQFQEYKSRSRDLHRQHRGLMQWRPMRNVQFAKDEAKFAVRRLTKLGSLSGRQPDVETEV
jgi:hypothetical protein